MGCHLCGLLNSRGYQDYKHLHICILLHKDYEEVNFCFFFFLHICLQAVGPEE